MGKIAPGTVAADLEQGVAGRSSMAKLARCRQAVCRGLPSGRWEVGDDASRCL